MQIPVVTRAIPRNLTKRVNIYRKLIKINPFGKFFYVIKEFLLSSLHFVRAFFSFFSVAFFFLLKFCFLIRENALNP